MKNCFYCHSRMSDSAKVCSVCGKSAGYTKEVLDRAARGDYEIQRELYLRTRDSVHSQLLAQGVDPDHVTSLMKQVYLDAYQNLSRLHNPESFPDLMLAMAKQEAGGTVGVRVSSAGAAQSARVSSGGAQSGSAPASSGTGQKSPKDLMGLLTPQQRTIVSMHYQSKFSVEEIARRMGISPAEVNTQISAAAAVVSGQSRPTGEKPEYTVVNLNVSREVKDRAMGQDPDTRARTEAARRELEERTAQRPVQPEERTRTVSRQTQVPRQSDVRTYETRQSAQARSASAARQNARPVQQSSRPETRPQTGQGAQTNNKKKKKAKSGKSSPVVKVALVFVAILFVIMVVFFVRELADRFSMLFQLFG